MRQLKSRHWYLILAIFILVVYGRTLFDPLLWWDDRQHICQNPLFTDFSFKRLLDIWSQPYFGLYAPLTYSVWILPFEIAKDIWSECLSFGPAFHGFGLLLHLLNSFLVLALLHRLTPSKEIAVAFWGALLFSLHPLQVETVAWVSAQRDLLSALFGLAALNLFIRNRLLPAALCFSLSLFAKATGVIFPLLAVVLLVARKHRFSKKMLLSLLLPVLLSLLVAILAKSLQADQLLRFEIPFWQRPLIFLQAFGFYIWKVFFPWNLVPIYKRSVMDLQNDLSLFWISAWALIPIVLAVKFRELRFSLAWILVALLPVSGLVSFGFQEISTVADRYFYIPMIGISFALAHLLSKPKLLPTAAVFGALGLFSFQQAGFWRSDEILFRHNVIVEPQSTVAHSNLGNAYYHKQAYTEAEQEFLISLKLDPRQSQSWLGLARTYDKTNRLPESQATYEKSIIEKAALPETFNNLAVIHYSQKNLELAEKNWQLAAQMNPTYFEPRFNLGILYLEQNRRSEAQKILQEAAQISPSNPLVLEKLRQLQ